MTNWNRICCPVDFSAVSRAAMLDAVDLTRRFGGRLTLLHVDELPPAPSPDATLAPVEALRATALERDRQLDAWRAAAEHAGAARVDCAVAAGDPATEIVAFAAAGRYDVVVMGTHGRTGRDRTPFGSVAQKVILEAPCPVLVVRARPPER